MLRNINNFFNILKKGRVKKTLTNGDMFAIGTRDSVNKSKYYDTAISFKDLKSQIASASGVTAVTGTAPIVSSGGTTPAISIPKATGSTDGFLDSASFLAFSAKQDALTLTTTGSGAATLVGSTLNVPTPAASPLLTATATLTAANIIAGAGVTILPAPTATKYYVIHSLVMKFKGGSVGFDQVMGYRIQLDKGVTDISGTPAGAFQQIDIPTSITDAILYWGSGVREPGLSVTAGWNAIGSTPTVGDSEVVFDVTYELKDF